MPPTLPSPIARDLATFGMFLMLQCGLVACGGKATPPVAPGPPIAADPEVSLRTMPEECDALIAALTTYKACPNLIADDRDDLDAWIERTNIDFAAGKKANADVHAQAAMALACHRATGSVEAATQRCLAGPRPKNR